MGAVKGPGSAAAFQGRWSISRGIVHSDGLEGRFEGHATVTPAGPDRYVYHEEGHLTLGASGPLLATRRYVWRAKGRGVNVFFHDGAPFHRIDLSGPRTAAVHTCAPDRYAVAYDFTGWPRWTATWRVEGPRKDYEMVTAYAPA